MENNNEIIGLASDDQIKMWKAKHRVVKAIEIVDEEDTFVGYFARPTMEDMSAVAKVSKTDEIRGAEVLFDSCWLGGAEMIRNDVSLKMAAIAHLNVLISSCSAEVKNL